MEKTLHQLSPFFASIFLLFPRNAWYSGYFYFPDSSQISAMVGDHSRQIENSNLYRRGRRRWISHITNPLNCWAPVPLSRKFQFLAHFPFPAKFIGRIPRGGGTRDFKWRGWSKDFWGFEIFDSGIFLGTKIWFYSLCSDPGWSCLELYITLLLKQNRSWVSLAPAPAC